MITTLVTAAAFIGAIFGMRFRVFVLIPTILVSSTAIFGTGIAQSENPWGALLTALLVITALQVGYLTGATVYFVVARARARKDQTGLIVATPRR
jgi:hypothetical protein